MIGHLETDRRSSRTTPDTSLVSAGGFCRRLCPRKPASEFRSVNTHTARSYRLHDPGQLVGATAFLRVIGVHDHVLPPSSQLMAEHRVVTGCFSSLQNPGSP